MLRFLAAAAGLVLLVIVLPFVTVYQYTIAGSSLGSVVLLIVAFQAQQERIGVAMSACFSLLAGMLTGLAWPVALGAGLFWLSVGAEPDA